MLPIPAMLEVIGPQLRSVERRVSETVISLELTQSHVPSMYSSPTASDAHLSPNVVSGSKMSLLAVCLGPLSVYIQGNLFLPAATVLGSNSFPECFAL